MKTNLNQLQEQIRIDSPELNQVVYGCVMKRCSNTIEIKLNHVIKWLKFIYPNKHDFTSQRFKVLELWNLDFEYLKDQPKELIDFLFNLIQK